jgi:ADP-ribosylglycohydrolase
MTGVVDEKRLYSHILGGLAAAGMGDALGAATEQWHHTEIFAKFGGPLRSFQQPPPDTWSGAESNKLGQVTDDASQMYYLAHKLIECNGSLSRQDWVDCLLQWADESPHVGNMGPTTRLVVEALREGNDPNLVGCIGSSDRQPASHGATNGAAMRVAPTGLIHPGDMDAACSTALITCIPSHNTQIAISSACAIAAGVAHAVEPGANVFSVVQACLYGAICGEELAKEHGRIVPGPSILVRTELAVTLALRAKSLREAIKLLEDHIGNSVDACQSVPAAIGLFVFSKGDPLEAIVGGTNIGNDTDTIAAIAGALAGALSGVDALPRSMYETFCTANADDEFDVEHLARGLTNIAIGGEGGVS